MSTTSATAADVERAIGFFVERLAAEPDLASTFVGVDQARVRRHATTFVIAALGGPDLYHGRSLRDVHAAFALRDQDFDLAVDLLVQSFRDAGIAEDVIAGLAGRLEPLRPQIVTA